MTVYFEVTIRQDGAYRETVKVEADSLDEAMAVVRGLVSGSPSQVVIRRNRDGSIWRE
jgi:hypothetical protein